jgi:hypothetical protein
VNSSGWSTLMGREGESAGSASYRSVLIRAERLVSAHADVQVRRSLCLQFPLYLSVRAEASQAAAA